MDEEVEAIMIGPPAKWELEENDRYFAHARNNGDNYYDPESWDIAPDTPQELIDSFNETMKQAVIWREMGLEF